MNPALVRLSREQILLEGLDLGRSLGLELGPLDKPLVKKSQGKVLYADHSDREALRDAYSQDPNVDCEAIEVDISLQYTPLTAHFGGEFLVDYVIASHVIEHVPNPVKWLAELSTVLRPGGQLRLAVPDSRFSFDFLRAPSGLSELVAAHLCDHRTPQVREAFDFFYNAVPIDTQAAWRGEIRRDQLFPPSRPIAMQLARDALDSGKYLEIHCWVFTPKSFAEIMTSLAQIGLVQFACRYFVDTRPDTLEFFVSLVPSKDNEKIVASWRAMAHLAREHSVGKEPSNSRAHPSNRMARTSKSPPSHACS